MRCKPSPTSAGGSPSRSAATSTTNSSIRRGWSGGPEVRQVRALYPDGSRYRTAGLFAQDTIELLPGRLRAMLGGRLTGVRFRTFADRNPGLGVADLGAILRRPDLSFEPRWQATSAVALFGVVSRGFRAPNLNDLGALGLNDLGYEVPAAAARGRAGGATPPAKRRSPQAARRAAAPRTALQLRGRR